MNNKFLLSLVVILTLALGVAAAAAEPSAKWEGIYCTSGGCGVNAYNYNYGYYPAYSCPRTFWAPFRAEFIRDVNYPDGTYVMPGTSFTKTWRLRNVGTQAWTTDMRLVFYAGDPMNAVSTRIPHYVAPGNTVDVSVRLTAPAYGGTVSGQWMLQAPDGTLFGVGCNGQVPIWVSVRTWTNGACACLGQPACNCMGPSRRVGRNPYCNNKIRDIKDVTYPDGATVAPGAAFRKTWRMKNGGTCVWDENYFVTFFFGDDLGFDGGVSIVPAYYDQKNTSGPKYQGINRPQKINVHPGEYVYVSVDLKAPTTPGNYESYFKLRDNLGYEFGFGSYADSAFWVNINVSEQPKVAEPAAADKAIDEAAVETAAEPAVETAAEPAAAAAEEPAKDEAVVLEAAVAEEQPVANLCGEQTISMKNTDTGYQVLWTAVNSGEATWDNYKLVKSDSNPAIQLEGDSVAVPVTAPGETAEVSFNVNIDGTAVTADPLWMEFYVDSGEGGFCQFYFEAPAK